MRWTSVRDRPITSPATVALEARRVTARITNTNMKTEGLKATESRGSGSRRVGGVGQQPAGRLQPKHPCTKHFEAVLPAHRASL
jgi:hypothetical protein